MQFIKDKQIYETRIRNDKILIPKHKQVIDEEVQVLKLINKDYDYQGYVFIHFMKEYVNGKSRLNIHSIEPLDGSVTEYYRIQNKK